MVKLDNNHHQCEECGMHYEDKEIADKCEDWCTRTKSCSMEFIVHSVEHKSRASNAE